MMVNPSSHCSNCGSALAENKLGGLCPECVGRQMFGADSDAEIKLDQHVDKSAGIAEQVSDISVANLSPGELIEGKYRLDEKIGEGGFAVVYRVEQLRPVKREVALKLIKPGMDSNQVIARFEAERQALAIMDHPNIAKVHDAGAAPNGRPFFVMELVGGESITEYCDEHKLTTEDRLGLFCEVCAGIQHAHQKGVIHRDIKPSNILMTTNGGAPQPKVIDFGIAKATQMDLTDKTVYTKVQQIVGTPAYMSPEQAGMTAADVDTRSDVYSLGVLLYELLTGRTPFETKGTSHETLCRKIREEDPSKPSTQLSTLGAEELEVIANSRQTSPSNIQRLMRGDLDWIVMKALEKDRTRRYPTANGFAADIQRFLADEPVTAVAPSRGYLIKKFARRNRRAIAFAGTVAALLIAGVSVSTIFALLASQAANDANLARENADRLTEQAENKLYYSRLQNAHGLADSGDLRPAETALEYSRPGIGDLDRRGWEWYYLRSQISTGETVRWGHPESFYSRSNLFFSPDGKSLALPALDRSVRVWDLDSGSMVCSLAIGGNVSEHRYSWSADSEQIAWIGVDHEINISDATSGEILRSSAGNAGKPVLVVWSPDGTRLASWSPDKTIRIWDAKTVRLLKSYPWELQTASVLVWSPTGRYLTGIDGDTLTLIDCETWEKINGPPGAHWFFHFRAVWNRLETSLFYVTIPGEELATLNVWHPFAKKTVVLRPSSSSEWADWSPDDAYAVIKFRNERAFGFWDGKSGNELPSPPTDWPQQEQLVTSESNGDVMLWDPSSLDRGAVRTFHHGRGLRYALWGPNRRYLVSHGGDTTYRVWEPGKPAEEPIVIQTGKGVGSLSWSPDGKGLATATLQRNVAIPATVQVYDLEDGGRPKPFSLEAGGHVSWGPDGSEIAAGVDPGQLKIWDSNTGNLNRTYRRAQIPDPPIRIIIRKPKGLRWHPDGRMLAMGTSLEGPVIWDLEQGVALHTLSVPGRYISDGHSLRWSPDGSRLAVAYRLGGGLDSVAEIWMFETERFTPVWHKRLTRTILYSDIAWHPDGSRIAVADGDLILILDPETGNVLWEHRGHVDTVNSLSWNSDGNRLASGSDDGTVRIWQPGAHSESFILRGHESDVTVVSWSPDGLRLASSGMDRTVRIWDATSGYRWGRHSRRLTALDQKIAINSNDAEALRDRADIFTYSGQWKKADRDLAVWFSHHRKPDDSPRWHTTDWWVNGPYGSEKPASSALEKTNDPFHPPLSDADGLWRLVRNGALEYLDFGQHPVRGQTAGDDISYYALARLYSPVSQNAEIALRADGAANLWINGDRLSSPREKLKRILIDPPDRITVSFKAGWNTMLAKVTSPASADQRRLSVEIFQADQP